MGFRPDKFGDYMQITEVAQENFSFLWFQAMVRSHWPSPIQIFFQIQENGYSTH